MTRSLRRIFQVPPAQPAKISLVIPVYNEALNLPPLLRTLEQVKWPLPCELVFVDDGSEDGSRGLLKQLKSTVLSLQVHLLPKNRGKGAAIQKGIELATGDILAVQDADLEYDPHELPKLIAPILEGRADVVYGSRFRQDAYQVHRTFHRFVNRVLTLLSNYCSGIHLTDMETCYKVFHARILKSFALKTMRFGFEPEVTAYIAKFSIRVLEFPISYFPRNYIEGKKIGWRDGVAAVWFIFRFNFLRSPKACLKKDALERLQRPPSSSDKAHAA